MIVIEFGENFSSSMSVRIRFDLFLAMRERKMLFSVEAIAARIK